MMLFEVALNQWYKSNKNCAMFLLKDILKSQKS